MESIFGLFACQAERGEVNAGAWSAFLESKRSQATARQ